MTIESEWQNQPAHVYGYKNQNSKLCTKLSYCICLYSCTRVEMTQYWYTVLAQYLLDIDLTLQWEYVGITLDDEGAETKGPKESSLTFMSQM